MVLPVVVVVVVPVDHGQRAARCGRHNRLVREQYFQQQHGRPAAPSGRFRCTWTLRRRSGARAARASTALPRRNSGRSRGTPSARWSASRAAAAEKKPHHTNEGRRVMRGGARCYGTVVPGVWLGTVGARGQGENSRHGQRGLEIKQPWHAHRLGEGIKRRKIPCNKPPRRLGNKRRKRNSTLAASAATRALTRAARASAMSGMTADSGSAGVANARTVTGTATVRTSRSAEAASNRTGADAGVAALCTSSITRARTTREGALDRRRAQVAWSDHGPCKATAVLVPLGTTHAAGLRNNAWANLDECPEKQHARTAYHNAVALGGPVRALQRHVGRHANFDQGGRQCFMDRDRGRRTRGLVHHGGGRCAGCVLQDAQTRA